MIVRLPAWRAPLDAYIDAVRRQEFAWDRFHCGHFAAGAVEAVTGQSLGGRFLRARTERGALSAMRRAGFDNLADLAASLLPEIVPSAANVGDIAAIPGDSAFGFALGVVTGERIFVIGQEFDGLGTVDLLIATRAFKVG